MTGGTPGGSTSDRAELRVLWWNVEWQRASRTDDQIDAVLSLEPNPHVVALCELAAETADRWHARLRAEGFDAAPARRTCAGGSSGCCWRAECRSLRFLPLALVRVCGRRRFAPRA
jgi:hypothetical protein